MGGADRRNVTWSSRHAIVLISVMDRHVDALGASDARVAHGVTAGEADSRLVFGWSRFHG
jgi:hypothetical protein